LAGAMSPAPTASGRPSAPGTATSGSPKAASADARRRANRAATNSADLEFTFVSYTAATRTLLWTAENVDASGTVTYQAKVDIGAAKLAQPLTNVATIDSDQTEPDSDTSDVFVPAPPKVETGPPTDIEVLEEPWVKLSLVTPSQYIGSLMELSTNRRGEFMTMEYLDPTRVVLHFEMPLAELIIDYFDQLKSRSQGYASMDYEELGYRPANLAKVDILVNGEPVDALSMIVHRDKAQSVGRNLTERLKQLIPRQMFEIPIQASIGSNVIARETVRAMRKNVLAKCYGGDITRKRKLLEKQKEGKQRMKRVGSVEIPQEAFLAMLRMDEG
jgi:hypothetical protein